MNELLRQNIDNLRVFEVKAEKVETLESEKSIVHYISTVDLDRGRDIVDPKGMDAKDFKKSPSVWYNHNYRYDVNAVPIAKSLWQKVKEDGVIAKTQFSNLEFADDIYYLHKNDFMKSWSIGWMPQLDNKGNIKDGALLYDEKSEKTFINLWALLEYSSAPMPMNPNALDLAKSYLGDLKTMKAKEEIEKVIAEGTIMKRVDEIFALVKELQTQITDVKTIVDGNEEDILALTQALNTETKQIAEEVKLEMGAKTLNVDWIEASIKKILNGNNH